MPETTEQRCKDAEGVLPLEAVLAREHDCIHGDDATMRIGQIRVVFEPEHIIAPAAFAHRWLRARRALAAESQPKDAAKAIAKDAPLDGVAAYILDSIAEAHQSSVTKALERCQQARDQYAAHPERQHAAHKDGVLPEIATADALLVRVMIPHLNHLLDQPIEREAAFASFIASGAIDALGGHDSNTQQRLRRLLIEAAFDGQVCKLRDLRLEAVYASVRRYDTAALCLSGGGIRSATFAVGVIRGLAHYGLLSKFDYLSTVSGGGYAGSWLSAWMHHTSAAEVQQELRRGSREKLTPEPTPMQHLRAYSHFLTPRAGMFSTDTWTLIATIGRNLLLNWLVLIPLMAAALLFPRYCVAVLRVDYGEIPALFRESIARPFLLTLFAAGLGLGAWAARFVHLNRPEAVSSKGAPRNEARAAGGTQHQFVANCFIPLAAAALSLTTGLYLWWDWSKEDPRLVNLLFSSMRLFSTGAPDNHRIHMHPVLGTIKAHPGLVMMFLLFGALMHVGGWLWSGRFRRHPREVISTFISGVIAGGAGLFMAVWFLSQPDTPNREILFVTLAPPAFLAVMLVGSQLFTALTSFSAGDDEREWVTRFNAWLLIAIVMWSAICALVLYGPMSVSDLWQQLTVAAVGGGSGLLGVFVARGAQNSRVGATSPIVLFARRLAMALTAPLFVVSVVIALAAFNEKLIGSVCSLPVGSGVFDCRPRNPRPNDYSHSQPFVVLARHQTEKVDSIAQLLGSTGADAQLLAAFAQGDSLARALKARGDHTDASWESLLTGTGAAADVATRRAIKTDSALRSLSTEFTQAVINTDTISLHGIGGDSILKSFFLHRAFAEALADSVLHGRQLARDSIARELDRHLVSIEATWHSIRGVGDSAARPHVLGLLHDRLDERLESSISTFNQVMTDSAARAQSHAVVLEAVRVAGQLVPYDGAVPVTVIILFFGLLGLGLLLGAHIDTNKFSLRAMYEMRLVRAYLGASRPACDRRPSLFTGFDPLDDVAMGKLWPANGATSQAGGRALNCPPMHVVNVTLNLVAGTNLAWQQRKSESMTISPLHAGSAFVGYRPTTASTIPPGGRKSSRGQLYGGRDGITLGTAVTISGAAASPNAGSHSSPMVTFLMTFFNARLGAWLGNPGRAGARSFNRSAPAQKIKPILDEMFGLTSDKSPYVYLSDGGHFENLALYEMVLRRCRFIVVSDAGCDPNATFDDLGNAVRKIRVDLGVPIEFPDHVHIFSRNSVPADGSGQYWAVGHIKYSAVDGGADPALVDGLLIYLKPALYGNEPSDVQQYSRTSPDFPHESTSDQFFSESQFESYRALGEFTVRKLVDSTLASKNIDVKGVRPESLLSNWSELLKASDSNVRIPPSESGVWPTPVEKRTA